MERAFVRVTFPARELPEALHAAADWLERYQERDVVCYELLLDHTEGFQAVVLYVSDDARVLAAVVQREMLAP